MIYIIGQDTMRTDRQTDGQTDGQSDSYIPPTLFVGGYNNEPSTNHQHECCPFLTISHSSGE